MILQVNTQNRIRNAIIFQINNNRTALFYILIRRGEQCETSVQY